MARDSSAIGAARSAAVSTADAGFFIRNGVRVFRQRGLDRNGVRCAMAAAAGLGAAVLAVVGVAYGLDDITLAVALALTLLPSSRRVAYGMAAMSGASMALVTLGGAANVAHSGFLLAAVLWRTYRYFAERQSQSQRASLFPASWIWACGRALRTVCLAGGLGALAAALVRGTPMPSLLTAASLLLLTRQALPYDPARPLVWVRTASANAALLGVFSLVSLGALEWGVRHVTLVSQGDFYLVPDPGTDFTLGRNAYTKVYIAQTGAPPAPVVLATSAQGLRDDVLGPKSDSEFRVVMLGDSYTMGWGLAPCDTYARQLNAMVSKLAPGRTIRVINAGVGGFAPWQERVFLRERCFRLQPDLVILQIYPENDVPDTAQRNGEYLRAVSLHDVRNTRMFRRCDRFPYRLEYWLRNHWYTYRYFIYSVWKAPLAAECLLRCRLFPEDPNDPLPGDVDRPEYLEPSLKESYPELDRAYAAMESDILGIQRDCRAQGVDLFAFVLPCPFAVNEASWRSVADTGRYIRFNDVFRVQEQFRRDGIPYVSRLSALRTRHKEENVFLPNGHLNPAGATAVARCLAEYLVSTYLPRRGLLASPHDSGVSAPGTAAAVAARLPDAGPGK